MTDDMTPFEELLKPQPSEPQPNCVTAALVLLGTLLLVAFFIVGIITTIVWLLP